MRKGMKYRYKVLKSIYPYSAGVKRYWMILLVFSTLSIGLKFVIPVIYKFFIRDVIIAADLAKLHIVIVGYLSVFGASLVAGYIKNWARCTVTHTVLYRVRQKILNNFLELPFPKYESTGVGEMKMCMEDDTNQVNDFAGKQTIDYVISCITVVGSVWILFRTNWILAVFSMISIPFTFWLDDLFSRHEKIVRNDMRENNQEMSSWIYASVQGWREVKALNFSRHEARRYFSFLHNDMIYNAKWINFWTARILIIPKIKDECFMQFGLYFIGGLLIMAGKLGISDLLVFASYFALLSEAIKSVSSTDADLQANMPYTDRLMESLKVQEYTVQRNSALDEHMILRTGTQPEASNIIELRNVTFRYPGTEKNVLENFSLIIQQGERIAIVGDSGSGKTTILKLITGMLAPNHGQVLFASVDLQKINIAAMHSRTGLVMQENILFNTTIRENLFYGKKDAAESELWEACKKACIDEFIVRLPDGLDTVIGEKGIKLSGGQRQRIVLARMFLQESDIVIFDEATSALDQYSESIIHDAINSISREKTIIVVAHRESSIRLCDRVVRIE